MFFPLTKNEKFWDKNKKLLFIEDLFWMSKAPKELQELSYDVLDVDFCELDIDEEELHTFVVQLAEASGEILNEYHKVDFSHLYWKAVLFTWMRNFVPTVYLRVLRISTLQERFEGVGLETMVLAANPWQRPLLNIEELYTLDGDFVDLYGWHLYSLILQYEAFDIEQQKMVFVADSLPKSDSMQHVVQSSALERYTKRIIRKLRNPCEWIELARRFYAKAKLLSKKNPNYVEIVLSAFGNRAALLNLEINSQGKIVGFPLDHPIWTQQVTRVPEIQWEFRHSATEILKSRVQDDAPWKRVLSQIFFEEMPCSYIENFDLCRLVYQWQYEKYPRLKYIVSSAGASFTESEMAMAEQRERGVAFSFIAHGSARYSKDFRFWFGRAFSNVYYSWGACEGSVKKNIVNYRQSPAEKLYMYDSMAGQGQDILYVGDWIPSIFHKHEFHTIGRVLRKEIRFLEELEKNVRQDILVRNYPIPISKILDRWLKYSFPDIRLSREAETVSFKNETFAEVLLNSRLCILDHYDTPFLEILYINKPFILYFDESFSSNYFDPDTEQTYVDMMRSVGIIQYGPETAAKYLNEIYPRIEDWWAEPERQRVVQTVKDRYVGSYTDPEAWWYQEIMGLLSGEITW